jgi:hypothetical protein
MFYLLNLSCIYVVAWVKVITIFPVLSFSSFWELSTLWISQNLWLFRPRYSFNTFSQRYIVFTKSHSYLATRTLTHKAFFFSGGDDSSLIAGSSHFYFWGLTDWIGRAKVEAIFGLLFRQYHCKCLLFLHLKQTLCSCRWLRISCGIPLNLCAISSNSLALGSNWSFGWWKHFGKPWSKPPFLNTSLLPVVISFTFSEFFSFFLGSFLMTPK